jgi:hypothetical protein
MEYWKCVAKCLMTFIFVYPPCDFYKGHGKVVFYPTSDGSLYLSIGKWFKKTTVEKKKSSSSCHGQPRTEPRDLLGDAVVDAHERIYRFSTTKK